MVGKNFVIGTLRNFHLTKEKLLDKIFFFPKSTGK